MNTPTSQQLPPILLKPAPDGPTVLYSRYEPELVATLSFRSLNLSTDLHMIHEWVNQAYARRFWQLAGSKEVLQKTYETMLQHHREHSFIGCINDTPICQIDVYGVQGDELETHTEAGPYDCGLHLLMLPARQAQKGWSNYALKNFQRFYFSWEPHQALYAEPDQENTMANKLAMDSGFVFYKTIELSHKTANLYSIARDLFTGR